MSIVFGGPEYGRPDPIAFSDTVDNLRNGPGGRATAIQNRSEEAVRITVAFAGTTNETDTLRVLFIPSAGVIRQGSAWKRVMITGSAGITGTTPYETILTTGVGLAFTNQPANDGVEIVSASAADTTQSITLYGTTNGSDTVVAETVALNGTTVVSTVKTDWGVILGYTLSASCAGTVTVREASGNATISTITTGLTSKGVETVVLTAAYGVPPIVVASGSTSKQIGLIGTNAAGATIYDSQALTGSTAAAMNSSFVTVTNVLTGDLEGTLTVTVSNSSNLLAYW
jgi:hypothetical protein